MRAATLAAASRALPLGDESSHVRSYTPKSNRAYLFPDDWEWAHLQDALEPVIQAAERHGYRVIQYNRGDTCAPGQRTIANFLSTSGKAGILYYAGHSGPDHLAVEGYCSKAAAQAAMRAYAAAGFSTGLGPRGLEIGLVEDDHGHWYLALMHSGIRNRWQDAFTIVQTVSCNTYYTDPRTGQPTGGLRLAFNAREFIGTVGEVCPSDVPHAGFWGRLDGTIDGGTMRNVRDAFAASDLDKSMWAHTGPGTTVLSPAVASVEPPPDSRHFVGLRVDARVTFDAAMSRALLARYVPGFYGRDAGYPCEPRLIEASWEDERTLRFAFEPRAPGRARIKLDAGWARSADGLLNLDGNLDPAQTDHVGPNGDNYEWEIQCIAGGPSPTPTSGVHLPPTATPEPYSTTTLPPSATSTPTLPPASPPAPTPTPAATPAPPASPVQGAYLSVSPTDGNHTTHYEVHFDDPALEAQRDAYTYSWALVIAQAPECPGNLVVSAQPWRASWAHPACEHPPGETITAIVTRDRASAQMTGPALGPAVIRPPH